MINARRFGTGEWMHGKNVEKRVIAQATKSLQNIKGGTE